MRIPFDESKPEDYPREMAMNRPTPKLRLRILAACALGALSAASGFAISPVSDETFLQQAVAAYAAGGTSAPDPEVWALAAAPVLDFRAHPSALGRLWVQELARGAGEGGLVRRAREEAAGSGEAPVAALTRIFVETARADSLALVRTAARLFTGVEPEASPSRLKIFDLEAGALDAASPGPMAVRHRTLLPDGSTETLRIGWPADGSEGAAVVRYEDTTLPPDVVFFRAGDHRSIPLSGVARIDFVVAGSEGGVSEVQAPVDCVRVAGVPYSRLDARATSGPEGPRLRWTTASHDGIWGWAVFREEVLADGHIARTGPQLVPSAERAEESYGYVFVDTRASAGTFYRYTVWAVTDEGLLTRAFSATLRSE